MRREYRVEGLAEPISHYADAVRAGDLLFISSRSTSVWKLVGGDDVAAQARQVFANMRLVLDGAGWASSRTSSRSPST